MTQERIFINCVEVGRRDGRIFYSYAVSNSFLMFFDDLYQGVMLSVDFKLVFWDSILLQSQ